VESPSARRNGIDLRHSAAAVGHDAAEQFVKIAHATEIAAIMMLFQVAGGIHHRTSRDSQFSPTSLY
jgi:hypothetical protein